MNFSEFQNTYKEREFLKNYLFQYKKQLKIQIFASGFEGTLILAKITTNQNACLMAEKSCNLVIDIGNTRTKVAVFENDQLIEKIYCEHPVSEIKTLLTNHFIKKSIYLATGNVPADLADFLKKDLNALELSHKTNVPIKNLYGTPETLGRDRLAAVVGAQAVFPDSNCLIIDAGTCITYDWLTKKGEYLGGNIAPGITMRLQAMDHFTAKLPLVEKKDIENPIGKSTELAMRNGALWGSVQEVDGYIGWGRKNFKHLKVVFTGGDTNFFVKHLKRKIFARPNIVLTGLNKILSFNA